MLATRLFMNQTWTDLNSPTKEEVDSLVLTQNINPIVAKDLLTPTPTQYAEDEGNMLYMVLHIPYFKRPHSTVVSQEVDFIISTDNVVTGRYDSIDALHYFAKQIEVNEILNRGQNSNLFFGIMNEIYKSVTDELSHTEDWMREIEKNIFEGREKQMVFVISNAGRNILDFRRIIEPHGNILEFLMETGREKFGVKFETEVKILIENWRRIMRAVNNQADLVIELRETNNSILSTKQNEIMRQLTIIGSVVLPLTIIGQIFGLSINSFPLMDHPYAFWIILGLMAIVMLITVTYAKLKKWM